MRLLLRCEIANLMQFFVGLYTVSLIMCSVFGFNKGFFKLPIGGLVLMDYVTCLKHLNLDYELRCGFFWFGNFKQIYKFLGLFLLFRIGFKFLFSDRFSRVLVPFLCDLGQPGRLDCGFCSRNGKLRLWKFSEEREKSNNSFSGFDGKLNTDSDEEYFTDDDERECREEGDVSAFRKLLKIEPHRVDASASAAEEESGKSNSTYSASDGKLMTESDEMFFTASNGDDERVCTEEDDVSALRKLLEIELHKVSAARAELERERAASASAAEEAMAMILRLQHEKSLIEMELKQFRRLAEEKQIHDQEVIRSLQWLVWQHESGRREGKVETCRRKDESEEFEPFNGNIMDALENVLYSSRE